MRLACDIIGLMQAANRKIAAQRFTMALPSAVIATGLSGTLLLAAQPLLAGRLPWRTDGLLHLYRLAQLERAWQAGILYPRWLPDLGFGFGFPLFNYYAPLSYYLLLPVRWLGLPLAAALRSGYLLALLTLALGIYLWARDLWGQAAGLAAAAAAVYAPYILYNAHHRGALPELWGLAWLSLAFWAWLRLARRPGPLSLVFATLCCAALLLSHNILAFVGIPLLAGYTLFLSRDEARPSLRFLLLPFGLGLGLSAFFWLPAFWEKELVQIGRLTDSANFFYGNNFLTWRELVAWPQTADPALVNPSIPLGLGIPQLALALLSWLSPKTGAGERSLSPATSAHRFIFSLGCLLLVSMTLPFSRPIWEHLPLLPFVQFPWRFLGPASLLLALLAGAGAARLATHHWLGLPAVIAALTVFALTWLFPSPYQPPVELTPVDTIRFEATTGALGTTSAGDYLPVAVERLPSADTLLPFYEAAAPDYIIPRLDSTSLPAGTAVTDARYGLTQASLSLITAEPTPIHFHWFYFPGWQARLDGESIPVYADTPHGLLTVAVPAGQHTLHVYFGDTTLRRWAWVISLFTLAGFVCLIIWLARYHPQEPIGQRPPLRTAGILACAVVGLALTTFKITYLEKHNTPFQQTAFDGRQVTGLDAPLQVNFGNQLWLLGYDLDPVAVPADGLIDLSLYWRAAPSLTADYSVAVHLLDEQGRRYGQADSYHPAGYPTSRWRTGEYARDQHRLAPWPGTPPGHYILQVTVYPVEGDGRLEILNEAGQPLGVTYDLTTITITHPSRFPNPADIPVAKRLEAHLASNIRLFGLDTLPASSQTGDFLPFTLYWQATAVPPTTYTARLRLLSADGELIAQTTWRPGRDDHPTPAWLPGEMVRDGRTFLIPAAVAGDPTRPVADGRYRLLLDLLDADGEPQAAAVELGDVIVQTPSRSFTLPAATNAVDGRLGEIATLASYHLSEAVVAPGDTLTLTLYWRAEALTAVAYTTFIHLVGQDGESEAASGRILAQQDRPPQAGARPTTGWLPSEIIRDDVPLFIPLDTPPGESRLLVGLYDPASGERLPASGRDASGDHLQLPTPIQVQAAP